MIRLGVFPCCSLIEIGTISGTADNRNVLGDSDAIVSHQIENGIFFWLCDMKRSVCLCADEGIAIGSLVTIVPTETDKSGFDLRSNDVGFLIKILCAPYRLTHPILLAVVTGRRFGVRV